MRTITLGAAVASIAVARFALSTAAAEERPIAYGPPRQTGTVDNESIRECSGIAAARRNDGCFWLHNDSGDLPRFFLIDRSGRTLAVCEVDGAHAIDWEDMASFAIDGRAYLLGCDVGDNARLRLRSMLYLVEEPRIVTKGATAKSSRGAAATIESRKLPLAAAIPFVYEHGPNNCESVLVDAAGKTIYLVTKEREPRCRVYAMPLVLESQDQPLMAKSVAELTIPTTLAGDLSDDGRHAVVLSWDWAYEFTRGEGQTWNEAFAARPRRLAMPKRRNGEAICYGLDGRTLYLTNEGTHQPLWEISPRPDAPDQEPDR